MKRTCGTLEPCHHWSVEAERQWPIVLDRGRFRSFLEMADRLAQEHMTHRRFVSDIAEAVRKLVRGEQ